MMEAIQLHAQNVETTAEVLFELLGYYGQGEATVDAQVTKFVQEHTRNHGIDVARDNEGNTLLIAAVRFQNVQAVDLLLGGDADPTVPNAKDATALHYAAASGNGQIVALLLGGSAGGEQAAFVGMRDNTGHTAASYAAQNGHAALIERLGGLDVGNKKITSKKLVDLPPLPRLSQGETLSSLFSEGETKGETKKPPPPPHPGHPSNNSNHGHEAASKWRRAAWVVGVRRYNQKKNAHQQLKR